MRYERLDIGVDNDACITWLEGALKHAYTRSQMGLLAYVEAVMEDVVFEMEWSSENTPSQGNS